MPLSVLCEQCSDQVWAIVSSSMSVGRGPVPEVGLHRLISSSVERELSVLAELHQARVVERSRSAP